MSVWNDVNEEVGVAGPNEIAVADRSDAQVRFRRIEAGRNSHVAASVGRLHSTNHNVLLQDLVIGESTIAGIKYVNPGEAHFSKEEPSERLEIRAVAKTSGGDRDHLTT